MTAHTKHKEVLFCFAFPEFQPLRLYASGISRIHQVDTKTPLNRENINAFLDEKTWLIGWMGYGLKSQFEKFNQQVTDFFEPDMCWIEPKILFLAEHDIVEVITGSEQDAREVFDKISGAVTHADLKLRSFVKFERYQEMFHRTMTASMRGDIYEANLCIPFEFDAHIENPYGLWRQSLSQMSAPFSCFVQYGNDYALSFSPERFLQRQGTKIISQPIKGTVTSSNNDTENQKLKNLLIGSFKDHTENRMVVDLLRNDFSRICNPGSVMVEELAGIKSYPGVHHLVSTVSGTLGEYDVAEILRATFPMASMTGIPKHRMISLLDEIEMIPRGIYSGAFGYMKPNGDFDFNVVIRTLLYHSERGTARISAGGAITSQSSSTEEYKECLIKIQRLIKTLDPNFDFSLFSCV
ncbi:MAG: chorismate-binding protein [Flavobacteriales bacterium]